MYEPFLAREWMNGVMLGVTSSTFCSTLYQLRKPYSCITADLLEDVCFGANLQRVDYQTRLSNGPFLDLLDVAILREKEKHP